MAVTAAVGVGVVGAGAGIYSASKSASAQKSAAKNASQTQLQMYNQTRADLKPYRQSGYGALNALDQMAGISPLTANGQTPAQANDYANIQREIDALNNQPTLTRMVGNEIHHHGGNRQPTYGHTEQVPQQLTASQQNQLNNVQNQLNNVQNTPIGGQSQPYSFQTSPGYQFRFDQGLQALDRSAAANGSRLGGAATKAALRYGQGVASNEFSNQFNRLATLSGLGQSANNTTAQLGANAANQISSNQLAAGNAASAGYTATGNAINSGINNGLYAYGASQGWFGGT